MKMVSNRQRMLTLIVGLILALALGLLFLYVRQRLFTQTEPIVLAT